MNLLRIFSTAVGDLDVLFSCCCVAVTPVCLWLPCIDSFQSYVLLRTCLSVSGRELRQRAQANSKSPYCFGDDVEISVDPSKDGSYQFHCIAHELSKLAGYVRRLVV